MTKYLNLSWKQFANDSLQLAHKLQQQNENWHTLIAIARGGLVPATIVAHHLGIRWVDSVCINSYNDNTNQQQDLKVLKELKSNNQNILVIDDLVDTGETFTQVKSMFPNAHLAAVYAKPLGVKILDTTAKEVPQETWIVFPWEDQLQSQENIA